jgi:non-specific serine/threonine protein kinase/serine/threonine-protein kinase
VAEQNLELRKRHLGPTHANTLVSMNNVAWLNLRQNRPEKALPLFEETLAAMRTTLAPLHPERINTTANLARAYHAAEQIDKAVPLQEAVVQQFKTVHGLDDARTQSVLDNLIGYYVDVGRCDKAEALLASVQSGGANRPPNVGPRQDQRESRHRDLIRRVRPAADAYQREVAAKKDDHPDTLAARQALAVALREQNRTSAAAYHLRAVLDARQRLAGADHPDTQATRLELGATRLLQKRYAEAEPLLLEAYAGLRRPETNAPDSKSRATEAAGRLVQLYEGWGKTDKAAEWRQKLDTPEKQ